MGSYGVIDGSGSPRPQEASGEWKTVNVCLKRTAALQSIPGLPLGHVPIGTLIVTDTDNTDGCYNVVDTVAVRVAATQDLRHVLVLVQDVYKLNEGDQQVAAAIEAIWTRGRVYYNGPEFTNAEEDLFRQRITVRWDGV